MTPIRGGTSVERDPAGRSRSVSIVTDREGHAAIWVDGSYVGAIVHVPVSTAPFDEDLDEWVVDPRGSRCELPERFVSGVEAVDALLGWFYENGPV